MYNKVSHNAEDALLLSFYQWLTRLLAPTAMPYKHFVPMRDGTWASRQQGTSSPCLQQVHFGKVGKLDLTHVFLLVIPA